MSSPAGDSMAADALPGRDSQDPRVRPTHLPFHLPEIGDEEIRAVTETLRSGWLTTGPRVKQFETEFAQLIGARHAIALNSCTAALHLALEAAGVGRGAELIV